MDKFDIVQFLKSAVAAGASDEHLKVDYVPYLRKNGFIMKTNLPVLTKSDLDEAIVKIAPPTMKETILNQCDVDFMYEIKGCSRFRINYNRQLGNPALVIRNISYDILELKELFLPSILSELTKEQSGIVFVTGPTGSGKSTTMATLLNRIAKEQSKHIITIEDPTEYVFMNKKSIISQRQVGVDTASFSDGIKYALRQDPDIIFIGEIRDQETMAAALKASETGHLVFTTLHTNDAVQTINRVVNMFEESSRDIVRRQLAETLKATIAQKLVYSEQNKKRYPACEVMLTTPAIKDYIIKDNLEEVYNLIKESNSDRMFSLNVSLFELVEMGLISGNEALEYSNDSNELEKMLRGVYQGTRGYNE